MKPKSLYLRVVFSFLISCAGVSLVARLGFAQVLDPPAFCWVNAEKPETQNPKIPKKICAQGPEKLAGLSGLTADQKTLSELFTEAARLDVAARSATTEVVDATYRATQEFTPDCGLEELTLQLRLVLDRRSKLILDILDAYGQYACYFDIAHGLGDRVPFQFKPENPKASKNRQPLSALAGQTITSTQDIGLSTTDIDGQYAPVLYFVKGQLIHSLTEKQKHATPYCKIDLSPEFPNATLDIATISSGTQFNVPKQGFKSAQTTHDQRTALTTSFDSKARLKALSGETRDITARWTCSVSTDLKGTHGAHNLPIELSPNLGVFEAMGAGYYRVSAP